MATSSAINGSSSSASASTTTASITPAAMMASPPPPSTSPVHTGSSEGSGPAISDKLYMQLNASELTAIIMKGSPNSNDRDAGFCSGSSEGGDDLSPLSLDHHHHHHHHPQHSHRTEPSSPTDASEADSVDVKVSPICLQRNKRKSSEPSKVISEREELLVASGPLKKRIRYTSSADSAVVLTPPAIVSPPPPAIEMGSGLPATQPIATPMPSPYGRCTAVSATAAVPPQHYQWHPSQVLPHELMPNPAHVYVRHPGVTTLHRSTTNSDDLEQDQEQPLALVIKKPRTVDEDAIMEPTTAERPKSPQPVYQKPPTKALTPKKMYRKSLDFTTDSKVPTESGDDTVKMTPLAPPPPLSRPQTTPSNASASSSSMEGSTAAQSSSNGRPQQRNYKNMTRERRIEANARERTRVHTISAAYETLRRAVPSYSNSQKLSKLSVLRVACSYILTLSRMAGYDYSEDQSEPSIASCFDAVSATIQTEGKVRKKKDE